MNLKIEDEAVTVVLSERNVRALHHKLTMPGSARTITRLTDEGYLVVRIEDDATHYDRPEGRPGVMHPDTEAFINGTRPMAVIFDEAIAKIDDMFVGAA